VLGPPLVLGGGGGDGDEARELIGEGEGEGEDEVDEDDEESDSESSALGFGGTGLLFDGLSLGFRIRLCCRRLYLGGRLWSVDGRELQSMRAPDSFGLEMFR
jgi:hypothetical protein